MAVNLEEFPNTHMGKLCVILNNDDDGTIKLARNHWQKGTTCSITMGATAPVGTILYLADYRFGWDDQQGLPTTGKRYVLARVTRSERLRQATRTHTAWFKTDFVLIENG